MINHQHILNKSEEICMEDRRKKTKKQAKQDMSEKKMTSQVYTVCMHANKDSRREGEKKAAEYSDK